ncbi:MAG: BamA/TamA family outer membrane protein [Phycisphaerae bacterium]|nr:BamA/TamA family outer membrane protein [Phycisphaerae bacterium]
MPTAHARTSLHAPRRPHSWSLAMAVLAAGCGLLDAPLLAQNARPSGGQQPRPATTPAPPPGTPNAPMATALDDADLADRPIAAVTIKGLSRVTRQTIDNNIRVSAGQPFSVAVVREDVSTLYRLGQFATVNAEAMLRPDGTIEVVYTVVEQPIIREIAPVGNRVVSDEELRKVIRLFAGGPRDDFLLEASVFRIKELYREKGNYLVEVTVDESQLADTGILIFRIIEGPRVRIKDVEFVGNASFDADKLYSQIKTRTAIPLFRKGQLDEELLFDDVAALDRFYKERGFVDVRIDRRVTLSTDSKDAKVTFYIDEGRRYRIRNLVTEFTDVEGEGRPPSVLTAEQVTALSVIRPGDWFTKPLLEKSTKSIKDAYLLMGYLDANVEFREVRVGDAPEVDVIFQVREGQRSITGLVLIQGNFLTQDKVIRRLVRLQPGRPTDGRELEASKIRLERTGIFGGVRVTPQRVRPGDENAIGDDMGEEAAAAAESGDSETAVRLTQSVRDVIVEVKEKNTGAINFGVGVGTDSGLFGEVSLSQRNFDIADPPLTIDEFISGRAFRGAGQSFNLRIAPGTEVSNYSVSFVEPSFLESEISLRLGASYFQRIYDFYSENRGSVSAGLARRLGDLWTVGVNTSFQRVELDNFDPSTPIEVFESRGPSDLATVSGSLTRTDIDAPIRPSRGTQLELTLGQTFDFNGNSTWTFARVGATAVFTVDEDYLGRKSTVKLNTDLGYMFGDTPPTYDRYYLGGRSFRGFEFRTVSPKSQGSIGAPTTPNDQPIGGEWLFFAGIQYELPVVGDFLAVVAFIDSGTVTADPGFDDYRASIGTGVRLYIPQLGPAPLAFDLAYPFLTAEGDQTQYFSFAIELPF